jgi:FkbM family methyltransferase
MLRGIGRLVPNRLRGRLWMAILALRPAIPKELLARRGDCVVQVGTPKSETIRRLHEIVGDGGKVVVIEPEPANVERQLAYVGARALRSVIVVPKAAWNARGTHTLLIADRAGDHRLDIDTVMHDNDQVQGEYRSRTEVEVDTVDNILDELGIREVAFVEIAVNGAEVQVLQGMQRTLDRTDRLFVKGHARARATGKPINADIEGILRAAGFNTMITRPTRSLAEDWGAREGDVFAWKPA